MLQLKHSHIQQQLQFFVEELHADKGQRLEILIVILIAAELAVSVVPLIAPLALDYLRSM